MLRTLGIVEACFESGQSRARAARRLGGKSMLEWVVGRVIDCQQLDGVIVVTSDSPDSGLIGEFTPSDIPVFVGHRPDALGCLEAALEEYPAESVVRICARSPFVDPVLIDRLVTTAESHDRCDYVGYCLRDGRPAILSPVGLFAEWFRASALRRAAKKPNPPIERERATEYIYSNPQKFNVRMIPAPPRIDGDDVRLRVDVEEDWDNALVIFDALGPDQMDWQGIAELLDHQPAMRKRMAVLNRTHAKG